TESVLRLPSVIFGTLTIGVAYLLGKEMFGKKVGLGMAVLTAFFKIEILMSRQDRPYQAIQFFFLLAGWFLYKLTITKKLKWFYFVGFIVSVIIASLTHGLGLIILFCGLGNLIVDLILRPIRPFKKSSVVVFIVLSLILGGLGYIFKVSLISTFKSFGEINNLFYYRVFLWYNYPWLSVPAAIGFLFLAFKDPKKWRLLALPLIIQGIVIVFVLPQPFTRYFYPVFPFLVLFAMVGLQLVGNLIIGLGINKKKVSAGFVFVLLFFLISAGLKDKISFLPQRVYSLNEDMQEIPEADWKRIYEFVEIKLENNPEATLITNWNDLPIWYLGEGKLDFLIRKPTFPEVFQEPVSGAVFVDSLEEFVALVGQQEAGVLVVDSWDDQVPEGIREYSQANLQKELEVDRLYPVQPRYWPVEIYSWGLMHEDGSR
ncbi:ArnT family glycosyltransferase, partial [Patescibacteria group bacterium]